MIFPLLKKRSDKKQKEEKRKERKTGKRGKNKEKEKEKNNNKDRLDQNCKPGRFTITFFHIFFHYNSRLIIITK